MLTDITDVLKEAYKRNWITMRDGNISVKHKGKFFITPSGVRKYSVVPGMLNSSPLLFDGTPDLSDKHPDDSIEADLHKFLHKDPTIGTVVHLHPTNIVAAMYKGVDLAALAEEFPELGRYTKVAKNVPFSYPGSADLAENTALGMLEYDNKYKTSKAIFDLAGLERHGVVAIGKTPWEAFEHIERLEHICEIFLKSGKKSI